jgi:squalene synthase HpnC
VMRELQPTIRACSLPREPFLRLIEANRMDQRVSEYATWADLKHYCVHSADPVGRLVLGVLGRSEPDLVALSDDVCTGLQLVNFLQDVPRDLALGRVYLPAEDRERLGVRELDRPNPELRALLEFEADRARVLLASGEELGRRLGGGRVGRAVALFARGGLAALEALERADWDIFNGRPRPSRARLALAAIR